MSALLWLMAWCACLQSGLAVHYSPLLMQKVERVRIRQGLIASGWQGALVATPHCYNIGRVLDVSYRNPRTGLWSGYIPSLDVDCAEPYHLAGQLRRGLIVEASWETAQATGWVYDGRTQARVIWTQEYWR